MRISWARASHRIKGALLRRGHLWLEQGTQDPTTGKHELADLAIDSTHRDAGVHYLATPWWVLDWVQDALPGSKADWTFLDLGCGKGRALRSALDHGFGKVIGVEFAAELAATARAVVATHPRAVHATVHHADAATFPLPGGPLVVFLFNPFGPPVIDVVAARIGACLAAAPRPIVVAYLNPVHDAVFGGHAALSPVPLGRSSQLRFKTLSPYALKLYSSRDALAMGR